MILGSHLIRCLAFDGLNCCLEAYYSSSNKDFFAKQLLDMGMSPEPKSVNPEL